jgi:uncharacterized protein (DUF305 family)
MSRRRVAGVGTHAAWQQRLMAVTLSAVLVTVMVGLLTALGKPARDDGRHYDPQAGLPAPWSTADAAYVQAMLWHHQQARELANLVQGRTTRRELRGLAHSMHTARSDDIRQLTAWLRAHDVADSSDDAAYQHPEEAGRWFAGMMAPSQLQTLASTTGQRFDFLFVDMLVEHHKGAVVMAHEVLLNGRDPEVKILARRAAISSNRSIRQLTRWRRRWAEPFIRQLTSRGAQPTPASR